MKFGVQVNCYRTRWEDIRASIEAMEAGRWHSLWFADHRVGGTGERRTLRTLAMHGDIFNLDGWAGGGMSLELYRHKVEVLERHCEAVGRDPAEIQRTLLMPISVTDDASRAERFIKALGPGSIAGPQSYVIDRIGEFAEHGVEEIMFGAIPTGDVERLQRTEAEIVAAFD